MNEKRRRLEAGDEDNKNEYVSESTRRYNVVMKSEINAADAPQKVVTIKVIDIHFDDRQCSLIYMQDLTKFVEEAETVKETKKLLRASSCI